MTANLFNTHFCWSFSVKLLCSHNILYLNTYQTRVSLVFASWQKSIFGEQLVVDSTSLRTLLALSAFWIFLDCFFTRLGTFCSTYIELNLRQSYVIEVVNSDFLRASWWIGMLTCWIEKGVRWGNLRKPFGRYSRNCSPWKVWAQTKSNEVYQVGFLGWELFLLGLVQTEVGGRVGHISFLNGICNTLSRSSVKAGV